MIDTNIGAVHVMAPKDPDFTGLFLAEGHFDCTEQDPWMSTDRNHVVFHSQASETDGGVWVCPVCGERDDAHEQPDVTVVPTPDQALMVALAG